MISDEIKQSNSIKPPKNQLFHDFLKFPPDKGPFCGKVPSKNIYTLYLKHQNYPFCAPIFHPLSETESEHISENHTHQFKLNPFGNWYELGTYSFLVRNVSMIYYTLIYCIYWEFKEINHYLNHEVLQDAWKKLTLLY